MGRVKVASIIRTLPGKIGAITKWYPPSDLELHATFRTTYASYTITDSVGKVILRLIVLDNGRKFDLTKVHGYGMVTPIGRIPYD